MDDEKHVRRVRFETVENAAAFRKAVNEGDYAGEGHELKVTIQRGDGHVQKVQLRTRRPTEENLMQMENWIGRVAGEFDGQLQK